MRRKAILVGNSDGIGLAATKMLLDDGWDVTGISRSSSPISGENYIHRIADVSDSNYQELLAGILSSATPNLCIYLAGIGEPLNLQDMQSEAKIIEVNLIGMIRTAAEIIPRMVDKGSGHFIGISSLADVLVSEAAPSYHASKAGFSNYLDGLALAARPEGVHVTNVRFGFVDTKMAKGDFKPFMMTVEKAVEHLAICMRKKPSRYTAPKIVIPLVEFRRFIMRFGEGLNNLRGH